MKSENILYKAKIKARNLLANGHWQTIMPLYLTDILIKVEYTRERLDTPDGDFIDLNWINQDLDNAPTLILFHGMEGNSQSHYAKRIMYYLKEIGWRGVVAHARGCSEELNRTLNFYHAGLTTDIDLVVKTISARCTNQLFAAGISLGGNALLKYLGENNNNANLLDSTIVISTPFDLRDCSLNINQGVNRYLYQPYFMRTLLAKIKQYSLRFPELNVSPDVKTIDDFNNYYVVQLYQFRDSLDYYDQSSSIKYLKNISTPCMIIQAANDPLISAKTWPKKADLSNSITFVGLQQGGHVGFIGNNHNFKKAILKLPRIMVQYLNLFSGGNLNMTLKAVAQQTLGLIDLTTLNDNDTNEIVIELCKKAKTEFGSVPAICIFRQFIPAAKKYFAENGMAVKIATVTNFPHGGTDMELALRETQEAIDLGADEVDIVFPYKALMAGDTAIGGEMVKRAKQICGNKVLKVIIESGVLQDPKLIELASDISIANGADFIKTSTGKVEINATLEATEVMLKSIKKANSQCGFKAAGGIRLVAEAKDYLELTNRIMGEGWINSTKFRFGASSLLTDVLNVLSGRESVINNNLY